MTSPKPIQKTVSGAFCFRYPIFQRLHARPNTQRDLFCQFTPWPALLKRQDRAGADKPSLIGLAVQHRGGEPRDASELAIGPVDFRLPNLGAPAEMERAAERGYCFALWHGGDMVGVHLQPNGLLTFGQGQGGGNTA